MAKLPPPQGPKGFVASTLTQTLFKIGSVYQVKINNYPWSDAWTQIPAHLGDYLWPESYARQHIDGISVKILGWSNNCGPPPQSLQGDLGFQPYWAWTEMLTGPYSQPPFYNKYWMATNWLVSAATGNQTCQCTIQIIWAKGCQCGKP